jgi:hypothetical protein
LFEALFGAVRFDQGSVSWRGAHAPTKGQIR